MDNLELKCTEKEDREHFRKRLIKKKIKYRVVGGLMLIATFGNLYLSKKAYEVLAGLNPLFYQMVDYIMK